MFEAVRIDEVLANATANVLYGRPDIFNQVFEDEDLQAVCHYALAHYSTGVRVVGERAFIARGWNETVALINFHATDEQTARVAVNAWYAEVDASTNWVD